MQAAETYWDATLATATPSTLQRQTMTKKRFSAILSTPAAERYQSGRFESPAAPSRPFP